MQHEYFKLSAELSGLKTALQSSDEKSGIHLFKRIKDVAYRISNLMIEELSDWRITYHNRPLDLPV